MININFNSTTAHIMEEHPFEPFLPKEAQLLMLGTFPPAPKRWCMPFYYPNYQNDMWRIFGICFFSDKAHFLMEKEKCFNLNMIKQFLFEKGIALYDTATKIHRTKNTASDKDLEIIQPTDLSAIIRRLPKCRAVITAGQLATNIFCRHFKIPEPKVSAFSEFTFEGRNLRIYRMPSSSRAFPMNINQKAQQYMIVFKYLNL